MPIDQLIGHLAGRRLVGQLQGLRAEPLHVDYGDQAIRQDAAYGSVGLEVLELAHVLTPALSPPLRRRDSGTFVATVRAKTPSIRSGRSEHPRCSYSDESANLVAFCNACCVRLQTESC